MPAQRWRSRAGFRSSPGRTATASAKIALEAASGTVPPSPESRPEAWTIVDLQESNTGNCAASRAGCDHVPRVCRPPYRSTIGSDDQPVDDLDPCRLDGRRPVCDYCTESRHSGAAVADDDLETQSEHQGLDLLGLQAGVDEWLDEPVRVWAILFHRATSRRSHCVDAPG